MPKRKPLLFYTLVFAIVALFATSEVMAASPTFPTADDECMVIYGDVSKGKWFTLGPAYGPNGEWPTKETCVLDDSTTREVAAYDYVLTGGKWSAGAFYQTIPGMRPDNDQYEVDLYCSFSSITYIPPGFGTGSTKTPCFADYLGERALIHYTSAYPGNPPKFGHRSSSYGVGWSSLAFEIGNDVFFCMQYDENGNPIGYGLPGPELGEDRIIKNTVEYRWVGPKQLRLEINYRDCTFKAFDLDTGQYLDQFPVTDLKIARGNGTAENLNEQWAHGKCDQLTFQTGENSCIILVIGGYACEVCY